MEAGTGRKSEVAASNCSIMSVSETFPAMSASPGGQMTYTIFALDYADEDQLDGGSRAGEYSQHQPCNLLDCPRLAAQRPESEKQAREANDSKTHEANKITDHCLELSRMIISQAF